MKRNFELWAQWSPARAQESLQRTLAAFEFAKEEISELIRSAPQMRIYRPDAVIDSSTVWEARFIVTGWTSIQFIHADGRKQIAGFSLPGDFISGCPRGHVGELIALTPVTTLHFDRRDMRNLGAPTLDIFDKVIARASERRESHLLNHVLRLGAMNATQRILHLFVELHERLRSIGMADSRRFTLPITQEMLGDALGLSAVHVSRVLTELRRKEILDLGGGEVVIRNAAAFDRMTAALLSRPAEKAPTLN